MSGFCSRCGASNPDGAQFCAECGQRLALGAERAPITRMNELDSAPGARSTDEVRAAQAPARTVALENATHLLSAVSRSYPSEVLIGRDPTCTVVIDNAVVSARHARLSRSAAGALHVADLGSTNGTFVNGVRVQSSELTLADELRVGSAGVPLSDPKVAGLLVRVLQRPARGEPIVLGAGPGVDVVIDHPGVAPRHAEILESERGLVVRSLAAAPGTFIDGPHFRVEEALLTPNSLLLLGAFPLPVPILVRLLEHASQGSLPIAAAALAQVNLDRPLIQIGRGVGNDLVLQHPTVSTKHATFVRRPDGSVLVTDLGSTNGTYIDGERVGPRGALAKPGQRVIVGAIALAIGAGGRIADAGRAKVRLDVLQLGLSVPDRSSGAQRVLLDRVTMSIFPGELVGMLGPSGAGKSTLLMSVLGLYRPTQGGVLLNGRPLFAQYESFRTNVGYVPQDDIVHPQLTVREALWFACRLRLPTGTSRAHIESAIESTLKQVGLWEQRDLQIGSPEEKVLSGGQRRRVNLAVELVTDPSLLVLDEPTSGLSWTDAADVITTLRRLADDGRTIVLTIHQPDYQEYEKFDAVAILGRGGKLLFYGPPTPDSYEFFGAAPGKPREMFDHVEQMPADSWRERFHRSSTFQRYVVQRTSGQTGQAPTAPPKPRRRSSWRQFPILLSRALRLTLRTRTALLLLLVQAPLLGLLIGLTTSGSTTFAAGTFGCRDVMGSETVDSCAEQRPEVACDAQVVASSTQARVTQGLTPFSSSFVRYRDARIRDPRTGLLAVLMALFLPMIIASSNVLVSERTIYERERLAGLNVVPYVLARYAVLVALGAAVTSLHLMVAIPLLELRGSPFSYWLVGVMVTSAAAAMGLALSAAVRSPVSALWGINFLVIPQLLFAGSITRLSGLTGGLSWLTTTRYALEALSHIDLHSRGHLSSCQIERYMHNYPGFAETLSSPLIIAASGTGMIALASLGVTMLLLRLR